MNATALSLWQVRVLAVALAIVGAGIMSLFMTSDAYAVADTLNSQTYTETGTADGTVDTITLTFDATVLACVYDAADWTINTAGTIGVTAITAISCTGGNGIVLLTVTTTADITGGGTEPVISYANAGTINSLMDSGVITAKASKTVSDLAKPQFSAMAYKDNSGDGTIDRISLAFTESVVVGSVLGKADLLFTGVGDFTSLAFGADATDLITGTIATLNVDVGTASTVQDTNDGAGTLAVSTQTNFRLDDATGNSNTTLGAQAAIVAITDGAKPVVKTWTYSDADDDGKVDTIVAAYTEPVVSTSVIALNDITLTGVGDFTALAAGATSTDLITDTVSSTTFTMGTESSAKDTEDNAGTLAISTQNAFALIDASANTYTLLGAQAGIGTIVDGAKPVINSFTYQDVDVDGKIDTILCTFSEEVVAGSVLTPAGLTLSAVGDFTAAAFGADTTDSITGTVTTATLTLGTESSAKDTAEGAGTIAITSQGTFSLVDTATSANTNNTLDAQSSSATFVDGAAPQISTITYSDADGDAKIDTFLFTYTESTDAASVLSQSELSLTGVGDFTALAFGGAGVTTDIADGGTTDTVVLTTESSAVDTNEAAGTIAVSTTLANNNNFSLTDGTNNNVTEKAEAQIAFVDGAAPMLVTTSPASAATSVSRSATTVLTFSEPISTGSFAWTTTNGPSTTNFSSAWTSSNAVLTLTVLGLLSPGAHTVTVTAAPDPTSNAFAGALAAIANPFTFTVIGGSTSTTTSSTDPTYDLTVTAPDGGETFTAGESTNITWTSSASNGSMSFANINLMYTVDGSTVQETIATGTTNNGVYAWTVPDIDTSTAIIQVVGTDLVDALATDASDEYFTIGSGTAADETAEDTTEDTSSEVDTPSTGTTGLSPVTGEVEDISVVSLGDYVRSPYFNTVYFIDADEDGTLVRRPFMDAQTFMTWQSSWDVVGTVTDATLPTMELGGPMLPKAGIVLIKIQSDARVFAIEGDNTIRWITSESVAIANYGSNWADYVIDVAPTLMSRFSQGDDVDSDENGDTGVMKTRAVVNM